MVLLLKKIGAHILLPTLVTLWGVVCTLQGLVNNYEGLIAVRFFLGMLEGEFSNSFEFVLSRF